MKKLHLFTFMFIIFIMGTYMSCNKSDEEIESISKNYTQYQLTNFLITINNDINEMNIEVVDDNVNFTGLYLGKNIEINNGKLIGPTGFSIYFITLENGNIITQRFVEPVFHCDCIDDPSPLNYCEDYVDEAGRLRCRGSSCCEGYITDDNYRNLSFKNKDGIIVATKKLFINNKKIN